jgi:hypothetical protein
MMLRVRTTLTIDDDLAIRLKRRARERGLPFKRVVNDALRAGLDGPAASRPPYRVPELAARARPGVELEKALALAGSLEDTELVRKLTLGR